MRQNKLSKGYTTSVNNFNQVSPTTSIIVDHHAQSEEEIASPSAINLITETSTNQTRTLHKSNILKSGFNAEDVNFLSKLKIICPQGKNRCEIPKTNFPCILCTLQAHLVARLIGINPTHISNKQAFTRLLTLLWFLLNKRRYEHIRTHAIPNWKTKSKSDLNKQVQRVLK